MRIRKRLALSSAAFSDLHLQGSGGPPPAFDQTMPIRSTNHPQSEEKEFGDDEVMRKEAKKNACKNDISRKIVDICGGGEEGFNKSLQPSSSSLQEGRYEVVPLPLKKRRGSFERNPDGETMKSKTNKKLADEKAVMEAKKRERGNVIMKGSRCSRANGRGWRCCQPTLVGYSLCEHHLGKGRRRSTASVKQPLMQVVTKKRKARSISSLLAKFDV